MNMGIHTINIPKDKAKKKKKKSSNTSQEENLQVAGLQSNGSQILLCKIFRYWKMPNAFASEWQDFAQWM